MVEMVVVRGSSRVVVVVVVVVVLLVMLERRGHDVVVAGVVVVVVCGEVARQTGEGLVLVRGVREGGDVRHRRCRSGGLLVVALRGRARAGGGAVRALLRVLLRQR